jgi:hypothetical protein
MSGLPALLRRRHWHFREAHHVTTKVVQLRDIGCAPIEVVQRHLHQASPRFDGCDYATSLGPGSRSCRHCRASIHDTGYDPRGPSRAFSSEVDTGSREENASKQKDRARFRFNRNGKGSSDQSAANSRRTSWLAPEAAGGRPARLQHLHPPRRRGNRQ